MRTFCPALVVGVVGAVTATAQEKLPDTTLWVVSEEDHCDELTITQKSHLVSDGLQVAELYELNGTLVAYALYVDYRYDMTVGMLESPEAWIERDRLDEEVADQQLRHAVLYHGGPDISRVTECWRGAARDVEELIYRSVDEFLQAVTDAVEDTLSHEN